MSSMWYIAAVFLCSVSFLYADERIPLPFHVVQPLTGSQQQSPTNNKKLDESRENVSSDHPSSMVGPDKIDHLGVEHSKPILDGIKKKIQNITSQDRSILLNILQNTNHSGVENHESSVVVNNTMKKGNVSSTPTIPTPVTSVKPVTAPYQLPKDAVPVDKSIHDQQYHPISVISQNDTNHEGVTSVQTSTVETHLPGNSTHEETNGTVNKNEVKHNESSSTDQNKIIAHNPSNTNQSNDSDSKSKNEPTPVYEFPSTKKPIELPKSSNKTEHKPSEVDDLNTKEKYTGKYDVDDIKHIANKTDSSKATEILKNIKTNSENSTITYSSSHETVHKMNEAGILKSQNDGEEKLKKLESPEKVVSASEDKHENSESFKLFSRNGLTIVILALVLIPGFSYGGLLLWRKMYYRRQGREILINDEEFCDECTDSGQFEMGRHNNRNIII